MLDILLITVAVIAVGIASITDLRVREVPDWVSFALIAAAFGIRILFSTVTGTWVPILEGILGFIVYMIIGLVMFYTRQWGGGDAKLLMGLGAIIGINFSLTGMHTWFLLNLFIIGALYGFLISIAMALYNWKQFIAAFKKFRNKKMIGLERVILVLGIMSLLGFYLFDNVFWIFVVVAVIIGIIAFYLLLFVKAVETSAFLRWVTPAKLTVGDWVAQPVKSGRKIIASPKDLGLEAAQIKKILQLHKKKRMKVLIKIGVPFIPSFFIAFIVTIILQSVVFFGA